VSLKERLRAIAELREKATPGPWAPDPWGVWTADPLGNYGLGTRLYDADQATDADAEFIATVGSLTPDDWAALLAALEDGSP
jgi:hypothetical protein